MKKIKFRNTYFIKLGEGGKWEEDSITGKKARIGWSYLNQKDIENKKLKKIEMEIKSNFEDKGAGTRDFNAFKKFYDSTSEDLWITFYSSKLWWCKLTNGKIKKDRISRYRDVSIGWHDKNINGDLLIANEITGKITRLQGFRGTICDVTAEKELLRVINGEQSEEFKLLDKTRKQFVIQLEKAIQQLHWKDFEILVDLIFREAGWKRISALGETMKQIDLELQEKITGDNYHVQVKSTANLKEFEEYKNEFLESDFNKLYFIVHSPQKNLEEIITSKKDKVELILKDKLADLVFQMGLSDWLMKKIR